MILGIWFFFLSLTTQAQTPVETVVCHKDHQIRVFYVELKNTQYICKMKKISETVVAGIYDQQLQATNCLREIEKSFQDLGWKCQNRDLVFINLNE